MEQLLFNQDLLELMKQFYVLTGLRIILFDKNHNEIMSYPEDRTPFCSYMRCYPEFDALCRRSDSISFDNCRKTQMLSVYKCHAGLIEATAPITDNGIIIGYIMFGQITDDKDKTTLTEHLLSVCSKYCSEAVLTDKIKKIKYKSNKQILAASKILDACASYILFKDMIQPSKQEIIEKIEAFIDTHLDEDLSVQRLCSEFKISRTRLYELFNSISDGGIASFIRQKRLSVAKRLLKTTDMPITEIAGAVGFNDYNYFLRVFKSRYKASPKKLRIG